MVKYRFLELYFENYIYFVYNWFVSQIILFEECKMKIFYSLQFITSIVLKNILIPIVYLVLVAYGIMGFYIYSQNASPGEALTTSSTVVQFGAIGYLLFGVFLVKLGDKYNIKELFSTTREGYFIHQAASLIIGLLSIIIFDLLSFGSYMFLMWPYVKESSTFINEVLQYITLYWGLAFIICFVIGFLLATWIKGKFIYPVILLIYVLITPINFVFLGAINNISDISWDKILNIGEPNPTLLFNPLYGFSLSSFHWAKSMLILCVVILLLIFTYIKQNVLQGNRKKWVMILTILVIFIPSVVNVSQEKQILNDDDLNLHTYYRDYNVKHSGEVQPYEVENIKIMLNTKKLLEADTQFFLTNKDTNTLHELVFSLFHELKVKKIMVNNKKVNFRQSGDRLIVKLNKPLNQGEKSTLKISYQGLKTSFYFANQQAIYLPNYFNWIPSINDKPSFIISGKQNQLVRVNHQPNRKSNYEVIFKNNPQKIFTNLKQVSQEKWVGESKNGVTLMSGLLEEYDNGGMSIIYPVTWRDSIANIEVLERDFKRVIELTNKSSLLNKEVSVPRKIFFVPNISFVDKYEMDGSWYSDDHLILGFRSSIKPKSDFFTTNRDSVISLLVSSIVLNNPNLNDIKDYNFAFLYRSYMTDVFLKHFQIDGSENLNMALQYEISVGDDSVKKNTINQLMNWRKNAEYYNLGSPIYKQWTKLLESNQPWKQLSLLFEQQKEGDK